MRSLERDSDPPGCRSIGRTDAETVCCIAVDGNDVYISGSAGSVGIRKFKISTGAFTTFSAQKAKSLAFLNNTLYALDDSTGELVRLDTAGAAAILYTWKTADGNTDSGQSRIKAFGGKLLIQRSGIVSQELWLYDGSTPAMIAELPSNFRVSGNIAIVGGTVFIGGVIQRPGDTKAAIWYFANGTTGFLWQSTKYGPVGSAVTLAAFDGGLVYNDTENLALMFYNPTTGGTHTLGPFSAGTIAARMAAADSYFVFLQGVDFGVLLPWDCRSLEFDDHHLPRRLRLLAAQELPRCPGRVRLSL